MDFSKIFFAGWPGIGRTMLAGALGYAAMVFLLRVSGKRTLSKMNAFDLVVTVALGSILATIVLSKDVALAEGATAIAVLLGSQFVVAWLSVRFKAVSRLVKSEPALLLHRGEFLHEALRRERVTENEVRSAVRSQGIAALETVEAVILETDGSFSVVSASPSGSDSALSQVRGHSSV